ncbi:MAG: hypothetical protein UEL26_15105 [Segatella copri]|jgi:hypothetical protein|nr:hypothetical protein [Segatella copri]
MAIAIKTIPVLSGDVAERFIEIVECGRNTPTTVIPEGAQEAIRRMVERSKNAKIKLPL